MSILVDSQAASVRLVSVRRRYMILASHCRRGRTHESDSNARLRPATVLRYEDAPTPKAQSGEVVRVAAAGVNPIDWKVRQGFL